MQCRNKEENSKLEENTSNGCHNMVCSDHMFEGDQLIEKETSEKDPSQIRISSYLNND